MKKRIRFIDSWKVTKYGLVILALVTLLFVPDSLQSAYSRCAQGSFPQPINMAEIEDLYPLSGSTKAKLFENDFVVLSEYEEDYLHNAYGRLFHRPDISVFITSDAMLHVFHVVHEDILKTIEVQFLYDILEVLVKDLQSRSLGLYESVSEDLTRLKEAARRNVVFFTVACKLLEKECPVPWDIEDEVAEYVAKILAHSETEFYPGDDYTKYEPRGHYEGDPLLERYFRAMKWLGRRIFRIEDRIYPEDSHIELIQAVLIAKLLQESPLDMGLWERLYHVTSLLVGTADSITPQRVGAQRVGAWSCNATSTPFPNSFATRWGLVFKCNIHAFPHSFLTCGIRPPSSRMARTSWGGSDIRYLRVERCLFA